MHGDDYFQVLGVEIDVDDAGLKAAYRAAARDAHPDAGGTKERFQAVQEAHEVLSDPLQRRLYTAEVQLRQVRELSRSSYVPDAHYLPHLFDLLDPTERFHGALATSRSSAAGSTETTPGSDDRARDRAEDRLDDELIDEVRRTFEQRVDARVRIGLDAALTGEMAQRTRLLQTVGRRWRAIGALSGALATALVLAGYQSGVLVWLLRVEHDQRISAGGQWMFELPVAITHTSWMGIMVYGAVFGALLVKAPVTIYRIYGLPRWVSRFVMPGASVAIGATAPLWLTHWRWAAAVVVLAAVVWELTKDRWYLRSPTALAAGLHQDDDGSLRLTDEVYDEFMAGRHADAMVREF
jgi:curved DNA-binding protein CbpA